MPEPEQTETNPEARPKSAKIDAKIDAVRQFVGMMRENELTALDFIDGSIKIRLRRTPPGSAQPSLVYAAPAAPPLPIPVPQAVPTSAPVPAAPAAPSAPAAGPVIESPMVGTFYSSSAPDAPSFVSVGSVVRSDTTVCIIEAMKVFTDIPAGAVVPAGASGTITEVLVQSGQPVEYGQPLFRLKLG